MLETILFLINVYKQYRPTQILQPSGTGEMALVTGSETVQEELPQAKVSWYDQSACGGRTYGKDCKTANGEVFDEEALTLAHRTLRFGTLIEFRYGDRNVVCRVNDRGPFVDGREFDLSYGCFSQLSDVSKGVIEVKYEQL